MEKAFLIKAVTEYLKQALRYPNQNPDEPSLLVTASTGKADAGIYFLFLFILFYFILFLFSSLKDTKIQYNI